MFYYCYWRLSIYLFRIYCQYYKIPWRDYRYIHVPVKRNRRLYMMNFRNLAASERLAINWPLSNDDKEHKERNLIRSTLIWFIRLEQKKKNSVTCEQNDLCVLRTMAVIRNNRFYCFLILLKNNSQSCVGCEKFLLQNSPNCFTLDRTIHIQPSMEPHTCIDNGVE